MPSFAYIRRTNRLQQEVDQYYDLLTKSRQAETNSPTDQFCGFVDLIKGLVERRETVQTLTALDQLKQLLSLVRDRLDSTDPQREANHAELLELAATYNLPVSTAIVQNEVSIIMRNPVESERDSGLKTNTIPL